MNGTDLSQTQSQLAMEFRTLHTAQVCPYYEASQMQATTQTSAYRHSTNALLSSGVSIKHFQKP